MPIKLKKGLNLSIAGAVEAFDIQPVAVNRCALVPDDFTGMTVRALLKDGDPVKAGQPIACDKLHPDVKLVSPMAGTLRATVRGERRRILRFEIEGNGSADAVSHTVKSNLASDEAVSLLAESGLLAMMRTRPYDVVPNPEVKPRDIFVSCVYSAPLEVDLPAVLNKADRNAAEQVKAAVALLAKATDGKVYLGVSPSWPYGNIPGAVVTEFEGAHPAGNVSVQIEKLAPVNKGETVWTLDFETLLRVGRLALAGKFDPMTVVAVAGPEVSNPGLVQTVIGAPVADVLKGRVNDADHNLRVISGNILTGHKVEQDGYLRFPYRAVTVIAEGDDKAELLGWASMSPKKMSDSRTFLGKLFGKKAYSPDARLLGGRRAMILSGQYDKYMPMDIMPEYLIKAILAKNIEEMERLGIYEVAPEDFALPEYACASKMPLQNIVREGLEYMRKELS